MMRSLKCQQSPYLPPVSYLSLGLLNHLTNLQFIRVDDTFSNDKLQTLMDLFLPHTGKSNSVSFSIRKKLTVSAWENSQARAQRCQTSAKTYCLLELSPEGAWQLPIESRRHAIAFEIFNWMHIHGPGERNPISKLSLSFLLSI